MSISSSLRWNVLHRDNFTCQYCGGAAPDVKLEIDHVIPKSKGGRDTFENLITSCHPCNRGKQAKDLPERGDLFKQELDYVLSAYTDNIGDALSMLRRARNDALQKLILELDYAWAYNIWRETRLLCPGLEMYIIAAYYDKEDIDEAMSLVGQEITEGTFKPKNGAQAANRVQMVLDGLKRRFEEV